MHPDRDIVVGHVRRTGWTRVGFGLHRRDGEPDTLHADLLAWQQVLPSSGCLPPPPACFSPRRGLPPAPAGLPVFVSMAKSQTRPKRPEVLVMRHTKPIRAQR